MQTGTWAPRIALAAALLGCGGARPPLAGEPPPTFGPRANATSVVALPVLLTMRPDDGAHYGHITTERGRGGSTVDVAFGSLTRWARRADGALDVEERGLWYRTPDDAGASEAGEIGRALITRRLEASGRHAALVRYDATQRDNETLVLNLSLFGLWHGFADHPVSLGESWRDETTVGNASGMTRRTTDFTLESITASEAGPVASIALAGTLDERFSDGSRSRWLFSGHTVVRLSDGLTSHTELRMAQGDTSAARARGDAANGEGSWIDFVTDVAPR